MLDSLINPVFWQGFLAATLLLGGAGAFLAIAAHGNDTLPPRNYRAGDRKPWPGRSANDDAAAAPRSRRSDMRGGPR